MGKVASIALLLAVASPSLALADDQGAMTGAAGGAVAGALVGGPVGAVIGGAAGATMGGAATGPNRTVVVQPTAPCASRTTQMTNDDTGASRTVTTTDCP